MYYISRIEGYMENATYTKLYFFMRKEINFLLDRDFTNNLKVSFFFIFLCFHTLLQSHISKVTSRNKNDCKIDNDNFVIC